MKASDVGVAVAGVGRRERPLEDDLVAAVAERRPRARTRPPPRCASRARAGVGAVAAGTPKKVGKMACRRGWFWSMT